MCMAPGWSCLLQEMLAAKHADVLLSCCKMSRIGLIRPPVPKCQDGGRLPSLGSIVSDIWHWDGYASKKTRNKKHCSIIVSQIFLQKIHILLT